ncbi:MAG TPA: histidine kinase dimerization/phosphoacceptor domain -containing protein [Caulobacteraceae bacterium]|jgi:two-component sensor histidine kinase|nr:histidine kinase dimerization/phosphoacceptor domain -containing protein [Caulobacteraceae bacterium]
MTSEEAPKDVESFLQGADIPRALGDRRFKQFLDQMPIAVAISALGRPERIIYANQEFARLAGRTSDEIIGQGWDQFDAKAASDDRAFGEAVTVGQDYVGAFSMPRDDSLAFVDVWSNLIEDEGGVLVFRLVALGETGSRDAAVVAALEKQITDKDLQLRELQHRVKNNLQMITALIRIEARGVTDRTTSEGFDRLAGRVEALGILYRALTESSSDDVIDLGIYLSEIAAAVMHAHAVEGIHLDLQVDTLPVALDVAMPTGLVVNELLTNALKHAFRGRSGGVITLHSSIDPGGCRIVIADDGVGLPDGTSWPRPGKLSALIVRSLVENAHADLTVRSAPGAGMQVTISFQPAVPATARPGREAPA